MLLLSFRREADFTPSIYRELTCLILWFLSATLILPELFSCCLLKYDLKDPRTNSFTWTGNTGQNHFWSLKQLMSQMAQKKLVLMYDWVQLVQWVNNTHNYYYYLNL